MDASSSSYTTKSFLTSAKSTHKNKAGGNEELDGDA
jgi:hypothetical protein